MTATRHTRQKVSFLNWLAAMAVVLMSSCADNIVEDGGSEVNMDENICFSLSDAQLLPISRAGNPTYSGASTIFNADKDDNGPDKLIGCVIAYVNSDGSYTYIANTAWQCWYDKSLILEKRAYDSQNNAIENVWQDQRIFIRNDGRQFRLREDKDFAFFFYYPYNDPEYFREEVKEYIDDGYSFDARKVKRPHRFENNNGVFEMKGFSDDDSRAKAAFTGYIIGAFMSKDNDLRVYDATGYSYASWLNYPVVPMIDFRTLEGEQNQMNPGKDIAQLNRSDFMYAMVGAWRGKPINGKNTQGNISVILRKQLATIDFCFDENPTEVKLIPGTPGGAYMSRYSEFNLASGRFVSSSYACRNHFTQGSWWPEYSDCLDYKESGIYPRYLGVSREDTPAGATDLHVYRVIMTPQRNFEGSLEIKVGEDTFRLDNLQDNSHFKSLQRGTYYKLRIMRQNVSDTEWNIDIDQWNDGGSLTLERLPDQ